PQASAASASAGVASTIPASIEAGQERLRAGEFLQSSSLNPSGQIVTESETVTADDSSFTEPVDALKDLETVAAAAPPPLPPPSANEPRGLEWYLNRKGLQSGAAAAAPAPFPAAAPPASAKPELLGYDQSSSYTPSPENLPAQTQFA